MHARTATDPLPCRDAAGGVGAGRPCMCDACDRCADDSDLLGAGAPRPIGRRALLRRGLAAGGLLAAGWLLPDLAVGSDRAAAAAGDGGDDDGSMARNPPRVGAVSTTREVPAVNATSVPAPAILSRAPWGAGESGRVNIRPFAPHRKLIVHQPAGDHPPSHPPP